MEFFFMSSPIGFLEICIKQNKLYSISKIKNKNYKINSKSYFNFSQMVDKNSSFIFDFKSKKIIKKQKLLPFSQSVQSQLRDYFKGQLKIFSIPLDTRGTDFQQKVWKALQKISWGKTQTYGQISQRLKIPKGARAIGNCCAKNPFLIVVPCHRVLSKKDLGGFALGLKTKEKLLFLENAYRKFNTAI